MARIALDTSGDVETAIPTSSMADIAFLLLIFFIVTTVFVEFRPEYPPELPKAQTVDPLKNRRNLINLWVSPAGIIQIDSSLVNLDGVAATIHRKLQANPQAIVFIQSDERTRYGRVSDVIEELRKANALRISFSAKPAIPGE